MMAMETPARKKFKFKHDLKIQDDEEQADSFAITVRKNSNWTPPLNRAIDNKSLSSTTSPKFVFPVKTPVSDSKKKPDKFIFENSWHNGSISRDGFDGNNNKSSNKNTPKFVIPGSNTTDHLATPTGSAKEFMVPTTSKDPNVWSPSPRKRLFYYDTLGVSKYVQTLVLDHEVSLELHKPHYSTDARIILNARRWNRFCYYLTITKDKDESQTEEIMLLDIQQKAPKTWSDKLVYLGPIYCHTPVAVFDQWELVSAKSLCLASGASPRPRTSASQRVDI